MVVKSLSPYNGIIGRPGLKAIQAVPSTVHEMLKFPTEWGIVTICSSLLIPAECASIGTSSGTPRVERTRPTNFTVALHPNFPDQEVVVGGSLSDRGALNSEHRLNIREECPPVQQKKRGQAPERAKAIQAEVQKLVEARIMREVYYHDWLSNPVESLCGYPFKCFLEAYKGYHQIQLAEADEEKTAFHTGQGVYYYTKMPFGLKNAGATYQRVMDKVFERQMGRNIEVYVDDLVVKSHTEAEMVGDIEETFRTLRKINMKLNPKKCSFGLAEGVFLGYVITPEGIKPCPDKTAAVLQLPSPQTVKELKQHLSDLPLLVAPRPEGELIMYLSATHGAISTVIMTERGTAKTSIYFISRALQGNASQGVPVATTQEEPWTLFTDGSSCVDGSGAGLILTNPEGVEFTYALRFQFAASNNEAEYEALVAGLRIVAKMGVKNVQVNVDSKLVANQVLGTYVAKEDNMIKYLEIVKGLVSGFTTFLISQVPRSKNKKADALSKIASTSFLHLSKQTGHNTSMRRILDNLTEVQDAVKEDPALNKKVLDVAEAYTKNSSSLTELLTLTGISSLRQDALKIKSMMTEIFNAFKGQSSSAPSSNVPTTTPVRKTRSIPISTIKLTEIVLKIPTPNDGVKIKVIGSSRPQPTETPSEVTQAHSTSSMIIITPPSQPKSSRATPITDKGKGKPVVITVYKGTNRRNFEVHNPFKFGDFRITELDELIPIIQKKKNKIVAPKQGSSQLLKRKRRRMRLDPELRIPALECNMSLPEGVLFIYNVVIEEPEYGMFFIDVFGDETIQRTNDINKVGVDTLITYLVMALNITTHENQRFFLKLRKLIADHPEQEKLKSKK
nr:reverse transcriptase domain-containing protein [Tanacetum cinerariifolium]